MLTFISRSVPDIERTLEKNETMTTQKLITNFTGLGHYTAAKRRHFFLPIHKGHLYILTPDDRSNVLHWSKMLTSRLVNDEEEEEEEENLLFKNR